MKKQLVQQNWQISNGTSVEFRLSDEGIIIEIQTKGGAVELVGEEALLFRDIILSTNYIFANRNNILKPKSNDK